MRLTIAAAALVGSASADHGRSNVVEAVGESDTRHKEVLTAVLPMAAPAPDLPSAAQESIASRSQRRSLEKRGVLRNLLVQSQSSSSRGECDPDVGLLACGFGQFCQSSAESSRGGLCRPIPDASFTRGLQGTESPQSGTVPPDCTDCLSGPGVYCDAASPFYGRLACECDDWTVANRTGTIDCVLTENLCNANCTESPATCYSVDFNYVTDGAGTSYQYCYNFVSPIEQTFCFGFTNDQTCFIAIDGTSCNSCNTTYQLNCEGDCFSEPCAVFDCENVGLGSGNSCLDKVIPPAYYQCWLDINDKPVNSECSLCPNSAGVLQPEKLVNLPKYGTFNCSYLERVASEGLWTTQRCSYTSLLAESICCSSISAQFQCNICGEEDHVVTKPEAMINFPSQPSISCGDLEALAVKGSVKETQCGIVKGFVNEVCSCKHPDETQSPTDSPQGQAQTQDPVGADGSNTSTGSHRSRFPITLASLVAFLYAVVAN